MEPYYKAKKDFEEAITTTRNEELLEIKNGAYGLYAMKFALKYTSPKKNQELYNKIYNIYYKFFDEKL